MPFQNFLKKYLKRLGILNLAMELGGGNVGYQVRKIWMICIVHTQGRKK